MVISTFNCFELSNYAYDGPLRICAVWVCVCTCVELFAKGLIPSCGDYIDALSVLSIGMTGWRRMECVVYSAKRNVCLVAKTYDVFHMPHKERSSLI